MKKFIKTITISIITISMFFTILSIISYAETVDQLLPPPAQGESSINGGYTQLETVRKLPDVSIEGLAGTAIKTVLGWSMMIALVGIVISGIYMLAFEGDSNKVEKAKNIIQYLIIGEIVISIAYGIVNGILQFKFF